MAENKKDGFSNETISVIFLILATPLSTDFVELINDYCYISLRIKLQYFGKIVLPVIILMLI